jgi:hypothetical protein
MVSFNSAIGRGFGGVGDAYFAIDDHHGGSAAITPSGRLAPATVGHGECGLLVGLQSELLGQHDIPKRKVPYRTEAPDGNLGLARTDLVDIHIPAAVNTIALGRVGAPHFKKSVCV